MGYVIAEPAVGLPFYLVKKILYDAPKGMLRKEEEATPMGGGERDCLENANNVVSCLKKLVHNIS